MRNKISSGEYLAFLSMKYEVDPTKLFEALVSAQEEEKSACGSISIERRGKIRDKTIFLITKESKVVAQFPISAEFLSGEAGSIRNFIESDMPRRYMNRKNRESCCLPIRDLRTGMSHVNLKARVLEIPASTLVFTRFGSYASVANALIADETGSIRLCLWNEQIDSIAIGDTIEIKNARMSVFRGEKQLRISKNGTFSSIEDKLPAEPTALGIEGIRS